MANIPYIHRIYGVFFNKCDKLVILYAKTRAGIQYRAVGEGGAAARPRRTAGTGEIHKGFCETNFFASRLARIILAQGP